MIYYVLAKDRPILALLIYGKNEQSDLGTAQRKAISALVMDMKRKD